MNDFCGLDIVAAVDGQRARMVIGGELDITTAPRFISMVHDLTQGGTTAIDVDCAGIEFLDSGGVRALIVSHNDATRAGIAFALVEPSRAITRVLDMTGLTSILT